MLDVIDMAGREVTIHPVDKKTCVCQKVYRSTEQVLNSNYLLRDVHEKQNQELVEYLHMQRMDYCH